MNQNNIELPTDRLRNHFRRSETISFVQGTAGGAITAFGLSGAVGFALDSQPRPAIYSVLVATAGALSVVACLKDIRSRSTGRAREFDTALKNTVENSTEQSSEN